jgi:hypothetical protein
MLALAYIFEPLIDSVTAVHEPETAIMLQNNDWSRLMSGSGTHVTSLECGKL